MLKSVKHDLSAFGGLACQKATSACGGVVWRGDELTDGQVSDPTISVTQEPMDRALMANGAGGPIDTVPQAVVQRLGGHVAVTGERVRVALPRRAAEIVGERSENAGGDHS